MDACTEDIHSVTVLLSPPVGSEVGLCLAVGCRETGRLEEVCSAVLREKDTSFQKCFGKLFELVQEVSDSVGPTVYLWVKTSFPD